MQTLVHWTQFQFRRLAAWLFLAAIAHSDGDAFAAAARINTNAASAAIQQFAVGGGLQLSPFASEPMLRNPTDMDIDERGRVWLLEGVNYRSTFQRWGVLRPTGDRVVIL